MEVENSKFLHNSNFYYGCVIYAIGPSADVSFTNTSFLNNTSDNGGVFAVSSKSIIKWTAWNITNNFAVSSGVIYALEGGSYKFYDSDIYDNYAVTSPISEITSSHEESEINGWRISGNFNLSSEYVLDTFLNQGT